jgi:hypothetical protein
VLSGKTPTRIVVTNMGRSNSGVDGKDLVLNPSTEYHPRAKIEALACHSNPIVLNDQQKLA